MAPLTPTNIPKQLTVTQDTTVQELNAFLDQAGGKDKIYGTTSHVVGADGKRVQTQTLYLAENASGPKNVNHDSNHSRDFNLRRKTGRALVATILKNAVAQNTDTSKTKNDRNAAFRDDLKTLMTNVIDRNIRYRPEGSASHSAAELTTGQITDVTKALEKPMERAQAINDTLPAKTADLPPSRTTVMDGPRTKLRLKPDSTKNLETQNFPSLNIDGKTYEPDRVMGAGSFGTAVRYKEQGGDTFKVAKFTRDFNTPSYLVSNEGREKQANEAAWELQQGAKFGADADHTLRFSDHAVMKNGSIALIGDLGAHGDVFTFASKMYNQIEKHNNLTVHAHRLITLTMAEDAAKGAQAIHQAGGIHGDMKPGNQVVDAEGKVRIIDFGLADQGPKVSNIREDKHSWGARYKAPEAAALKKNNEADAESARAQAALRVPAIKEDFKALFELDPRANQAARNPDKTGAGQGAELADAATADDFAEKHDALFQKVEFNKAADEFAVDKRADVYGVGLTAYTLGGLDWITDIREKNAETDIDGKKFVGPKPKDVAEDRKIALASDPDARGINLNAGVPFANHALVDKVKDPVLDTFLDDVLAPNPDNRATMNEVLNHPSMYYAARGSDKAVGSKPVRDMIKAIASGDNAAFEKAQKELLDAFPDPNSDGEFEAELDMRAETQRDLPRQTPVAKNKRLPSLPTSGAEDAPVEVAVPSAAALPKPVVGTRPLPAVPSGPAEDIPPQKEIFSESEAKIFSNPLSMGDAVPADKFFNKAAFSMNAAPLGTMGLQVGQPTQAPPAGNPFFTDMTPIF